VSDAGLEPTRALLGEVFPGSRIAREDYLRWLYLDNPAGPVVEADEDDDQGRVGHYAVVPVPLWVDGQEREGALSLNTAVGERGRGRGLFTTLAAETYERARARGITDVVGVANANSTPGFTGRLAFTLITSLPARVLLPAPGARRAARTLGSVADLDEQAFALAARAPRGGGLARRWSREQLEWRLSPRGGTYRLHRSAHALAVSAADAVRGVPVAILAGVLADGPLAAGEARALVAAACRAHRAPLAIHAGINRDLPLRGVPLPARLKPSPLNLIHRDLTGSGPAPDVARWEFLDFDAY
jgi:GNAT superfamily N-acetyltransferase